MNRPQGAATSRARRLNFGTRIKVMRHKCRRVVGLTLLVVLAPPATLACQCVDTTIEARYDICASIYIAEVVAVSPARVSVGGLTGQGRRVYLRVVESFKGPVQSGDLDVSVTFDAGSACGIPIAVGERLIIYGYGRSGFVGSCNSAKGDQMTSEVMELRDLIARRHAAKHS